LIADDAHCVVGCDGVVGLSGGVVEVDTGGLPAVTAQERLPLGRLLDLHHDVLLEPAVTCQCHITNQCFSTDGGFNRDSISTEIYGDSISSFPALNRKGIKQLNNP